MEPCRQLRKKSGNMNKESFIRRETLGEIIRFVLVGGLATLLHWLLYWLLLLVMDVYVAYTLAYIISFLFNFLATSYITFRSHPTWTRLGGMVAAHAVNYVVHMILLAIMLSLGVPERWAPIPVFCVAVPINFLMVRFVFKNTKDKR